MQFEPQMTPMNADDREICGWSGRLNLGSLPLQKRKTKDEKQGAGESETVDDAGVAPGPIPEEMKALEVFPLLARGAPAASPVNSRKDARVDRNTLLNLLQPRFTISPTATNTNS